MKPLFTGPVEEQYSTLLTIQKADVRNAIQARKFQEEWTWPADQLDDIETHGHTARLTRGHDTEGARMTDLQRRALHLASRKTGVFIRAARDIGTDDIRTQTANHLVAEGWAEQKGQRLYITRTGKHALTVPTIEPPIYLKARDGLTERRDQAAAGEPEVIDTDTLAGYWTEKAKAKHAAAKDKREAANRLRNRTRAA